MIDDSIRAIAEDVLPFCLFTHNAVDLNSFEFSVDISPLNIVITRFIVYLCYMYNI